MFNFPRLPCIVSRFRQTERRRNPIGIAAALFLVLAFAPAADAGLYGTQAFTFPTGTTELNDGTFLVSSSAGVASVQANALRLVQNGVPEAVSSFKIPDLDQGFPVASFDVTLRARMTATGTPADGWSINFGAISAGNGSGEGGFAMANGIVIAWDTYDNTGDPPSVEVFCNGVSVGNFPQTFSFDNTYRNVAVHWDASGLDVTFNNVAICTNLPTPGFAPAVGNTFAFSARTGGFSQDVYIDDLRIVTVATTSIDTGGPIISEFLAENRDTFEDEDVETPDWIEIYNGQNTPLDLSGWHLTNAEGNPALWTFPAITVAPYQYRIIYASGKNRTPTTGQLHTNFTLQKEGGYVALTRPDNSVASAFTYGPQVDNVSFGERGIARTLGFLETPTPGLLNTGNQAPGLPAEDVVFSRNGGLITAAVSVSIAPPSTPGAVVRYTTNNTVPTESSPVYSAPFSITGNTTIRARVFAPGQLPGKISSRTFLLLHSTLTNYNGSGQIFSSNLPIIVLDSFGVPVDSYAAPEAPRPFRLTYAAVIDRDPATGRASLDGPVNFEGRSGTHVRGESSSGFAQKQYSWEIWDEKNNDNDVSLLGLPAESDWILYGPYTDKTLMRNFIVYSQMLALNGDGSAMRTRFCEVFFNQAASSSISYSSYRGVYVLIEKIKRTNDRVDIAKLNSLTTDPNLITGGYIFKKDKPSPGNTAINLTSGQGLLAHDPEVLNTPQRDYLRTYLNSFDSALTGANFADPVNGYAKFIDPLSFIDNQWFVEIAKQIDGYRISAYFSKDRGGKISALPLWDYNLSLGNADYLGGESPQGWYYSSQSFPAYYWYPRLRQDPNYMQLHWDRYWQMRRGLFATDTILAEIDAQAALLLNGSTALIGNNAPLAPPATESPVARHYRKYRILGTYVWPNAPGSQQRIYYKSGNPVTAEIDHMKDWLTKRFAWIDNQNFTGTRIYRPPTFNQMGGNVPADFSLAITPYVGTPPAGFTYATGDIYYTSDGSDPRGLNGAIAGTLYTGPLTLTSSAKVKARLYTPGTPAGAWSPITSANFIVNAVPASATNLVVTELNYHPLPPTAAELAINSGFAEGDFEFIEIKNVGTATVDLTGARFTAGIGFTFQGDNAIGLAPGAHVILAANPAGFAARYGARSNVVGGFFGDLDNGGERLLLAAQAGGTILDFTYDDGWHLSTDGAGQTLVTYEQGAAGEAFSTPNNWRPSTGAGGSPGADEPPFVTTLDVSTVTATSVQLNAEVSPNGTATTLDFVVGTDRHAAPAVPAANSVTLVGQTINGLAPHTLYSYRAEAANSIGVRAGTEVMFTTLNREPVPLADDLHFPQRTPFAGAVLASDTDPDGDALTVISVTQGQFGVVSTDGANVLYAPSENYSGNDTFSYTVSDGFGGEKSAVVTLRNAAPVAAEDLVSTNGEEVNFDPRTNDTDADNDPLTVSAVTQGTVGAVAINAAGSITYTPGAQFFGRDSFAYTVTDGVAVATQNVVVRSSTPISVVRASSGQQIPDAPAGTVFGRLGAPSSSSFLGIMQTSGGDRERAIFASDGRMRLKVGDPAPGVAGAFIAQLQEPSGQAVVATLRGSGINERNNSALYVDLNESASPRLAIREGDLLPGSTTLKRFLSIDGNGPTIFVRAALGGAFVQKTNDVALLAVPPGAGARVLAREGDLVLGRAITLLGTLIGSRGTLAEGRWRTGAEAIGVRLSFPGEAHALYSIPANATSSAEWTEWARTGDSAGTGTLQSFGLPGFSPDGVSYRAQLALGSAPGVLKASDTLILRATSTGVDLLAAESAPVPGSSGAAVPGLSFKKFGDPVGGANSAAAFAATVAGSGVQASNSAGLWLATEENVTMIARAGDLAPGGGRWAKFESLALPDRAGSGPVFTATLAITPSEGVTAANNRGLWAADSTGALQLLLRTGSARPVNGTTRIIDKFVALAPASGSIGAARGVDDQGVVTVLATFTDRTQALIGIALP